MALALVAATGVVLLVRGGRARHPAGSATVPVATQADAELTRLGQAAAGSTDAESSIALGNAYAERGRWFSAIWAFQDALDRRPGDFPSRFSIGSALLLARLPVGAAEVLGGVLREHPGSEETRIALARALRAGGDPAAALATLRAAPAAAVHGGRPVGSPALLLETGRSAQALGRFAEAQAAFEQCLKAGPKSAMGHFRLGRLLLEMGNARPAVAALRRARALAPSDAEVACSLGLALRAAGAPRDESGRELTEAVRLQPANAEAQLALGSLYQAAGRWKESADHLARAITADASAAEPHRRMVAVMTAMGRPTDAAYHRGLDFLTRDQPPRAIAVYRELAAREPRDLEAVLMASLGFVKMKQNVAAVKEAARARPRFPHEPALLERLAMLYVLTHDQPVARRICEEWRASDPRDARPLWILGRIAANEGRMGEAIGFYEQALRIAPEQSEATVDLARALIEQGDPASLRRARDLLQQALARTPGSAELYLQLGLAHQALNDLEPARDALLSALDRDPTMVPALNAVVLLAPRLGRPGRVAFYGRLLRARQARLREEDRRWVRLWENPNDAEQFYEIGRFYRDGGAFVQAEHHFASALELRPGWPDARAQLDLVRRLQRVQ